MVIRRGVGAAAVGAGNSRRRHDGRSPIRGERTYMNVQHLQPTRSPSGPMSPRTTWFLAATLILAGGAVIVASILAADERMEAPRWVAAAAGAVFLLGGLAVINSYAVEQGVERPGDRWSLLLGALICSGLAAIAAWIAFGQGERRFRIGGSLPL